MPSIRTNNFPESGRGLGHVTATIFGSTDGYPSDSLASCHYIAVTAVSVRLTSTEIMHYSRRLPHSTERTDLRDVNLVEKVTCVCRNIFSDALWSSQRDVWPHAKTTFPQRPILFILSESGHHIVRHIDAIHHAFTNSFHPAHTAVFFTT